MYFIRDPSHIFYRVCPAQHAILDIADSGKALSISNWSCNANLRLLCMHVATGLCYGSIKLCMIFRYQAKHIH